MSSTKANIDAIMAVVGWIVTIGFAAYVVLALIGGMHRSQKVILDYGGGVYLERSALWGLIKSNETIRLLNNSAWDKDRHLPLDIPAGYDWYIKGEDGDWWPYPVESFYYYDGP